MLDYFFIKDKFDKYVSDCFQQAKDICGYSILTPKNERIYNEKVSMIASKYRHSLRVVNGLNDLKNELELSSAYEDIVKVCGLLHDIGRFKQAVLYNTFVDSIAFQKKRYKNHAEYGYVLLEEKNAFNLLGIDERFRPVIGTSVLCHQDDEIPKIFNKEVVEGIKELNPEKVISGTYDFTQEDINIIALLLQMIRDIDKIDILYQRSTNEIPAVNKIIKTINLGIENLEKVWGVSYKVLRSYNDLEDLNKLNKMVNIPVDEIPLENLKVDEDFKKQVFEGKKVPLNQLKQCPNYNFIYALWWTLSTFLNDMNFKSSLELIQKKNLLNQIYAQYPPKYHPLINEIFTYAEYTLLGKQIEDNKNDVYIRKISK